MLRHQYYCRTSVFFHPDHGRGINAKRCGCTCRGHLLHPRRGLPRPRARATPSVELFIHFMSGNTLLARVSCTSTLDRALKHVATSLNRKLGPDGDEGVEWYQLHCFDIEGQEIPNNAVVGELPKRVCDGIQVIVDADDMPALLDLDADDNGSGLPEDLSCDVEWLT